MIANTGRKLALSSIIGIMADRAQAPNLQDLQTKILQFEEATLSRIRVLFGGIPAPPLFARADQGHPAMVR